MFERVLVIYEGSEYGYDSDNAIVLNILWFWICLNNSWIFLFMPEYVWIYLVCVKMPISAWIAFDLHSLHCNLLSTWMRGYLFRRLHETRRNMKEHEAVFFIRKHFIFSTVARSIWFVFCFRLNILVFINSQQMKILNRNRSK